MRTVILFNHLLQYVRIYKTHVSKNLLKAIEFLARITELLTNI